MYLVMPVLRTVVLVFIMGFTARALPFYWQTAKTFDEEHARCTSARDILQQAAWLAVAWILLEVVVGWLAVRRRRAAAAPPAAPPAGTDESPHPPPHAR
ncbi:MAG TPA: hypothetical protein VFR85_08160 [Anaeromyxobacteraceae bacterium]|nr:hypothetical protein [Anaeromyxobacteraceae bacterium]